MLVRLAAPTAGVLAHADLAAVGTSGLFALAFLLFLRHVDTFERTPAALAVVAFVGGGIGATWAMALPGNSALIDLYAKAFGQAWASDWRAGLSAPFVEESSKGVVFLLLLGLAPVVNRTVYDGLIVGAHVGLGFQVLEDVLYGQNAATAQLGVDQIGAVLHTSVLRSITGVASHPLSDGVPVLTVVLMLLVTAGCLVMLRVVTRWGSARERGYLRDVLAPELAAGVVADTEVRALTATGRRERGTATRQIASALGGGARRTHVLEAIRVLARDISESRGEDTDAVSRARAELARVRRPHG